MTTIVHTDICIGTSATSAQVTLYKVTAVQVSPSNGPTEWQEEYEELTRKSRRIVRRLVAAE